MAVLGALGGLLGALGGLLEASWGVLVHVGASWAVSGASWGVLMRLGSVLWAFCGRLGAVLASEKPPKIAPRRLQDASQDELQHRAILASPGNAKIMENVMPGAPKKNLCLARTGSALK